MSDLITSQFDPSNPSAGKITAPWNVPLTEKQVQKNYFILGVISSVILAVILK